VRADIDLDQQALESAISTYDYTTATAIYTSGAHSKPRAECTLTSPTTLGQAVSKGTAVTFTSNAGTASTGGAYFTYAADATSFRFTYSVADLQVQPTATQCYVGGLPTASQSTSGCVATSFGSSTFTIGSTTYTATCVNNAGRTLQGFSTKAQSTMYTCNPTPPANITYPTGCPYTSYVPVRGSLTSMIEHGVPPWQPPPRSLRSERDPHNTYARTARSRSTSTTTACTTTPTSSSSQASTVPPRPPQ
jgi:hypothetical protein